MLAKDRAKLVEERLHLLDVMKVLDKKMCTIEDRLEEIDEDLKPTLSEYKETYFNTRMLQLDDK